MGGAAKRTGKGPAKGPGKGEAKGGSRRGLVSVALSAIGREEHVQRISEVMMMGVWKPGDSTRSYAATHSVSVESVGNYAGEASRRIAAAVADHEGFRTNVVTSLLGIAEVAKQEFHEGRDPAMGALANNGYGRLLTSFELAIAARSARGAIDSGAAQYEAKTNTEKLAQVRRWLAEGATEVDRLRSLIEGGQP